MALRLQAELALARTLAQKAESEVEWHRARLVPQDKGNLHPIHLSWCVTGALAERIRGMRHYLGWRKEVCLSPPSGAMGKGGMKRPLGRPIVVGRSEWRISNPWRAHLQTQSLGRSGGSNGPRRPWQHDPASPGHRCPGRHCHRQPEPCRRRQPVTGRA